jgi:hypothetical protein
MSSTQEQHPVQQLTTDRADPPLGEGVRSRRPHRRAQHPGPLGREDRVERGGELGFSISDEPPELADAVRQAHEQVAGLLRHPRPIGWAVTPSTCTWRVATSITNSTYSRCSNTVSTVKQVHRQHTSAWARRNRRQVSADRLGAASTPARCRMAQMVLAPELVAESAQFAVDAAVAPGRVLPGQPQHQTAELQRHAWTTNAGVGWFTGAGPGRGPSSSVVGCTRNPRQT